MGFRRFHPAALAAYFGVILAVASLGPHPILICMLFLSGLLNALVQKGGRGGLRLFLWMAPAAGLFALLNPLFNRRGATVLFYCFGSPVTAQAVLYGLFSGLLLLTLFLWCAVMGAYLDAGRLRCLLGRLFPRIGLILTMILRFLPFFGRRYRRLLAAQNALGMEPGARRRSRLTFGGALLGALLAGGFEELLDAADAMQARGAALPGRTTAARYRFRAQDAALAGGSACLFGFYVCLRLWGVLAFEYFPLLRLESPAPESLVFYFLFGLYACVPLFADFEESLRWRCIH